MRKARSPACNKDTRPSRKRNARAEDGAQPRLQQRNTANQEEETRSARTAASPASSGATHSRESDAASTTYALNTQTSGREDGIVQCAQSTA